MSKEYDFLNELADLLEKYNVEIESNCTAFGWDCGCSPYMDFDFQDSPYTSISFDSIYYDCETFREKAKEYK